MRPSVSLSDLPPAVAEEIDRRCNAFEQEWAAGRRPRLEGLLNDLTGRQRRALLLCALRVELEQLRKLGEEADPAAYTRRFPEDADLIAAVFAETPTVPFAPGVAPERMPCVHGYEVLGDLGRGAVGDVYLARSVNLKRLVALKLVSDCWAEARAAVLARRDAEALGRLNDPHVVQIYEVGEHNGRPFLTLEYVPGQSLAARLKDGPVPPTEAARLLETLARTLHRIHGCDLVHRDLKPANIMLRGEPGLSLDQLIPKVIDFGVAKYLDAGQGRTASGAIIGTPEYMAPEQADGHSAQADSRTDVYALGAILYECLTGRPPFKAASTTETLRQVIWEEPVSPRLLNKDVDRGLAFICLKCLEKDPAHRYQSAKELADDLERWLNGRWPIPVPVIEWVRRMITRRVQIEDAGVWARIAAVEGVWSLLWHTALALLLSTGAGTLACWVWCLAFHTSAWLFVWPMLRGRQRLDSFERGLLFNWIAAIVADILLFAHFCPPWGDATPTEIVRVYPTWQIVHGLMWVMEARLYWGRFYVLGFAYLLLAPLLPLFGLLAPVAFGVINATGLLWLADGMRRVAAEQANAQPTP
jgi:hypothetical protein